MKEKLDLSSIQERMIGQLEIIKGEPRAQIIVLQAHVEFLVDEILEVLIESEKYRGTKLSLLKKLDLLKDLDWIPPNIAKDISTLSVIRGFVAHRINIYDSETINEVNRKFKEISLVKKAGTTIFPENETMQSHLKQVLQLYFGILSIIYYNVYELKKKQSLKNDIKLGDYQIFMDKDNNINISWDSL